MATESNSEKTMMDSTQKSATPIIPKNSASGSKISPIPSVAAILQQHNPGIKLIPITSPNSKPPSSPNSSKSISTALSSPPPPMQDKDPRLSVGDSMFSLGDLGEFSHILDSIIVLEPQEKMLILKNVMSFVKRKFPNLPSQESSPGELVQIAMVLGKGVSRKLQAPPEKTVVKPRAVWQMDEADFDTLITRV